MNEKEIHETIKKLKKLGYGIIYPKPTRIVCDNLCFSDKWKDACEHDGVAPSSMFVVFSDDNPHIGEDKT